MSKVLSQSTQFEVKELLLTSNDGQTFTLTNIFKEINLFDNIFTPCRSGNILIEDAVNFFEKINIIGNETIKIVIDKVEGAPQGLTYEKKFKIYKVTDRKSVSSTTQSYILHFVNEDFIFSNQKKISQSFKSTYSETIFKILTEYLKVPNFQAINGNSGIATIYPTNDVKEFIIPNLTPFDAINWITKKSISKQYKIPDYLFYESTV